MKKAVKVIAIMLLAVLCLGAVGCSELGLNTEEEKECSHKYAVSVKEATAEEDGLKTLMCTKCGYTVTEIIPAGESEGEEPCEHSFTAETVAATPEEPGTKTLTCSKCGYIITEEIPYSEPAENGSVLYKHVIEWGEVAASTRKQLVVITDSPEEASYNEIVNILALPGSTFIIGCDYISYTATYAPIYYSLIGVDTSSGGFFYIDAAGEVVKETCSAVMANVTDTVTKL